MDSRGTPPDRARSSSTRRNEWNDRAPTPRVKGWGNVARRGAGDVREGGWKGPRGAEDATRATAGRPEPPDRWIDEGPVRQRRPAPDRRPTPEPTGPRRFQPPEPLRSRRPARVNRTVAEELEGVAGGRSAPHLARRLGEATRAYDRDRYEDAKRILKPLADEAPASPAVRELYGLTLYRLGRWREALRSLGAFHELTGSFDQHPTMADANRALGRIKEVERLWDELREASPSAELVTEGRIVMAGACADRGDVTGAIRLLEPAAKKITRPKEFHLRLWYALADLYEKAGEVPAARDLFQRILRHDRAFFDTAERLSGLG